MKKDAMRSDATSLMRSNTAFALDLYRQVKGVEGNLFFSPYSISVALAMTYAGARGNTARQMAQTLHFTLSQERLHPAFASLEAELKTAQEKGSILLKIANSLWPHVRHPFLEEFLALTKEYYGVSITAVNYGDPEAARQKINGWVEQKTEGKIKELIAKDILDALTRLVLVNAIYFKGNWASQFDKAMTKDAPFAVTPKKRVQAPLMTRESEFAYAERDDLQILELPYAGGDLAMLVLLPKQTDGLTNLEAALTVENLNQWTRGLGERRVRVFLPRFKVSGGFKLNQVLQSLGMEDAFDADGANFAGMDGNAHWLYIAAVLHKAFVDVNEEGTEAAAATAVVVKLRATMPTPIFRADHPFVFLIRDKRTGSILFLGRVVNPTE